MGLHIAGGDDITGSINLVYPIQAAIGHGSCTVGKAVSCNLSGSSQVFYAGHGTISRHAHITNRSGSGGQAAFCAYITGCSINREISVCALDGAIRIQGCFRLAVGISAGVDTVFIHH